VFHGGFTALIGTVPVAFAASVIITLLLIFFDPLLRCSSA
jgi:hypothetical protein